MDIDKILVTDELLFKYKRCHRRGFLNLYGEENQKLQEKDFIIKLKEERESHYRKVLENYNLAYQHPKLLVENSEDNYQVASATEELMRQGVDCIYQGVIILNQKIKANPPSSPLIRGERQENFSSENQTNIIFQASPTLLIKQNIPSLLGDWSYIPVNAYLGKNMKPEYKLISAFQTDILSLFLGINLTQVQIFLRYYRKPYYLNLNTWLPHYQEFLREFLSMVMTKNEPEVFISRQRCSLCQWYESCHGVAKSQQHLSLIPNITPSRYDALIAEGINDLTSLYHTDLSVLKQLFGAEIAYNIHGQSKALFYSTPIIKHPPLKQIPSHNIELYFDIEAQPDTKIERFDRTFDYLLGVLLVNYETKEQKYYSFLAENIEEEKEIWLKFLDFVNQYPDAPIFHYSNYEVETVRRLGYLYKTSSRDLQRLLNRLFDLHKFLINSLFLPVENYSLKFVGNWLGFQWRDAQTGKYSSNYHQISGDQCVFWYDQWLKTFDRTWLDYILIYNEDDCLGTYQLKKWLTEFTKEIGDKSELDVKIGDG
ncbi:TM0106 family RecB-like putative nuclease [Geminocystis sp. CENA526]|uniref:TM0106 family RecB-like putative nuclease n=1 Tax=Geminocystis sp. CENA526 TaxID=1355871 RepID=UPI003D6FEEAC